MSYNLLQSFLFLVTVQSTCEFKYLHDTGSDQVEYSKSVFSQKKKGFSTRCKF